MSAIDFFTDSDVINDPYPYFEYLRAQGPVVREPHQGVVVVTGYAEALAVYRDDERFSSINAPTGPLPGLPFKPQGEDIGPQIEQHRGETIYGDWLATMDRPMHTAYRSLLTGLITPVRMKANEEFMTRLADRQIKGFIKRGYFDAQADFARPFTVMVVADLLGIPEKDHKVLAEQFAPPPGSIETTGELARNPLGFLMPSFTRYIEERQHKPQNDAFTELSLAKFPNGTKPTVTDIVNISTFLFGAGQDTSARLLASSFRILGDRPDIQVQLRQERKRIPDFIEEVLRMEVPVKSTFRVAKVATRVGDVEVTPGTTVMLLIGAINRDPRRFDRPHEFLLDRKNVRDHFAFSRGIHACLGAPLARAEARISLDLLLEGTSDIRISETKHGPKEARRYRYEPTYLLRGLQELHLETTPGSSAHASPRAA